MRTKFLIALTVLLSVGWQDGPERNHVSKNEMTVSWEYKNDRIYFDMAAPTDGWVTIGFNESSNIKGNYLLMGHVIDGKVEVVEYYTISAGNYKPITSLGAKKTVSDVVGTESTRQTKISFSLPIKPQNKYQKNLSEGTSLTLLLAYSQEDDFQHHSIMRTSVKIQL